MRVLVTGVTGAIGIPLIRDLLASNHEVTLLVRLKHSRDELYKLYGKQAGRFDAFIHGAGKVQYYAHLQENTYLHNEAGTANAIALATELEIPRFVFLSTCYVAGKSYYFSERDIGDVETANNPYEISKIRAEALVRAYPGEQLILRLSTVIGHSKSGYIVNAGGYAGFVKGFWSYRKKIALYKEHPFWVGINPASTLNLVPSEWVVDLIRKALETSATGTMHISHPHPVNLGFLFRETFDTCLPLPLTYDREKMLEAALYDDSEWREVQKIIDQGIVGYFSSYITRDTTFGHELVKSIPGYMPPPTIDADLIHRQVEYMTHYLFAKKIRELAAA
jgi:nucleoside-diphosphate-sugar epimerase